eukprot:snap_masked-scaffold_2-processed-gene-19.1-mRNA-1 protein AED:1.00 eAED:1.00 QI:0/0/0/0/1/1/2/0/89
MCIIYTEFTGVNFTYPHSSLLSQTYRNIFLHRSIPRLNFRYDAFSICDTLLPGKNFSAVEILIRKVMFPYSCETARKLYFVCIFSLFLH